MTIGARQDRRHQARGRGGEPAAADLLQLLTFVAAGVECGLPLGRVREIVDLGALQLHAAPGELRGTITLTGGLAPVLDLGARLGSGETVISRTSCALVLDRAFGQDQPYALLIEGVRDLVSVASADLAPAPRLGGLPWVFGQVARLPDRLLPVLDIDRLLTAEDAARASALLHDGGGAQLPGALPPTT